VSDPIIDRSPAQIERLISESRIAIIPYGFSIVRTEWLHQTLERLDKANSHEHKNATQTA
jgi:hypothetical protein